MMSLPEGLHTQIEEIESYVEGLHVQIKKWTEYLLPDSWMKEYQHSTGHICFYSSATGKTSWDRQINIKEAEVDS